MNKIVESLENQHIQSLMTIDKYFSSNEIGESNDVI